MRNKHALPEEVLSFARKEIAQFVDEVNGVTAVVLATIDGFDIASSIRDDSDPARIAAMASSISAISSVVSEEATLGRTRSVIIGTDSGFAIVMNVYRPDGDYVVKVIANKQAVLGQVNYRIAQLAQALTNS